MTDETKKEIDEVRRELEKVAAEFVRTITKGMAEVSATFAKADPGRVLENAKNDNRLDQIVTGVQTCANSLQTIMTGPLGGGAG